MSDWKELGTFRQALVVLFMVGGGVAITLDLLDLYTSRVLGVVAIIGVFAPLLALVLTGPSKTQPPKGPPPSPSSEPGADRGHRTPIPPGMVKQ
jgi:hypothetical protein